MRTTLRFGGLVLVILGLRAVAWGAADGRDLFARNCTSCHGSDGKAQTPAAKKLGVRDLTLSTLAESDIRQRVLDGVRNERGVHTMKPFRDHFAADELAALITYVKSLQKGS